ncbi:MAG: CBS domain-containing protein [Rhodospirillales bacterium]|nr:CBS domain-containing protein [Rhodospirillales bacterium]MSP80817.1 CBS domain-containing protein [Rhodospirillales bacterium]
MPKRQIKDIVAGQQLMTVRPEETVRDAARKMVARNIAAVLVTSADGRPLGIFTERDMLRRVVADGLDPDQTPVTKVMTAKPLTVALDSSVIEAMRTMQERHVRHLPVTADGRAVGIVSIRDFLGGEVDEVRREQESRERLWEA